MYDIFISYSRHELTVAERIYEELRQEYQVWIDIKEIPVGQHWETTIFSGLDQAPIVLLIVSQGSIQSPNVRNEWQRALEQGKRIILLQFDTPTLPDDDLHSKLRACEHIPLYQDFDTAMKQLKTLLKQPYQKPDTPCREGGRVMLKGARHIHLYQIVRLGVDVISFMTFLIFVIPELLRVRSYETIMMRWDVVGTALAFIMLIAGWLAFRFYNAWNFRQRTHVYRLMIFDQYFSIFLHVVMLASYPLFDAYLPADIRNGGSWFIHLFYIAITVVQYLTFRSKNIDLWGGARGSKPRQREKQVGFRQYWGWSKAEDVPSFTVAIEHHNKDSFRANQLKRHLARYHTLVDLNQNPDFIFFLLSRNSKTPSEALETIITDPKSSSKLVPILLDNTPYKDIDGRVTVFQALDWSGGVSANTMHLLATELDEPDKMMRQLGVFPLKTKKIPYGVQRFGLGLMTICLMNVLLVTFFLGGLLESITDAEFIEISIVALVVYGILMIISFYHLFNLWRRGRWVLIATGINLFFVMCMVVTAGPFVIIFLLPLVSREAFWWFSV